MNIVPAKPGATQRRMHMFEAKKTLIVVYKDELLMNQLKKMVETHDDNEHGAIGTRDDSINIVSWTEKVWLGNKKAGNIQGKILFLGEIKGTDKLIPVIDVKFDECGVKFGWAGNQAVVYADSKVLTTRKDYDAFLEKLSALPVPSFLKVTKESIPPRVQTRMLSWQSNFLQRMFSKMQIPKRLWLMRKSIKRPIS